MKKILFPIFISLFMIFSSCSKESINQSENNEQKSGKVAFRIDKTNAPKEVFKITAYLTRQGFQTIQSSMNLLSDSTADLMISDVAVGIWHLKVDAENSDNEFIYTGESDVEVLEGTTVQVSLTLLPTDIAKGSINIFVTWNNKVSNWFDLLGNPVLTNLQVSIVPAYGLASAKVLFDDGKFKMWYTGTHYSAKTWIGYAESSDGIHWNDINSEVLTAGISGSWDDYSVGSGAVIKENGTYRLYYNGWHDQYDKKHIGLATSIDGIHWEKYSSPIIYADNNEQQIWATDLVKKGNTYYLYYCSSSYKIYLATSQDGVNWVKHTGNPILSYSQQWENTGVFSPTVIYDNNLFKMIYMDSDNSAFGEAVSSDGVNWTKGTANPVFTPEKTTQEWSKIRNPFVRKFGDSYRLYYSGFYPGSDTQIAVAFNKQF